MGPERKRRHQKQGDKRGSDADDVKRQIDSDPNNRKPIYQLVNVNTGGGKLIELIKASARHPSNNSQTLSSSSGSGSGSGKDKQDSRVKKVTVDSTSATLTLEETTINTTTIVAAVRGSAKVHKSSETGSLEHERDGSIDDQIHQLVAPLLYNRGRGKLVPLSRLWAIRLGTNSSGNDVSHDGSMDVDDSDANNNKLYGEQPPQQQEQRAVFGYRWVCWKLEERGFVGETALHICFLLSTPSHMILAQKLLKLFPMLINDTYTGDEYFGESSLHMAIVNENLRIVKLLLDGGANVHQRCLGSFFLPNDQKEGANVKVRNRLIRDEGDDYDDDQDDNPGQWRNSSNAFGRGSKLSNSPIEVQFDLHSNHFKSLETNYEGYTYWGEYPLSFAASLGLTDCYKLLLAKGADPNQQDSNGNSTLHICVIANRLDMFDLCCSNGANLNLINWLGLSPLALAAKLCRTQMFFHILTIQRHINWVFCNVAFVDYPLAGIDSINTRDGSCDEHSVLSIVTSGNSIEHLAMLDGLIGDLLQVKWDTSLRKEFRWWLLKYLLMLAISTLAYTTRLWARQNDTTNQTSPIESTIPSTNLIKHDQVYASANIEISSFIADKIRLINRICEFLLILCVTNHLSTLARRFFIETARQRQQAPGQQTVLVHDDNDGLGADIEQHQQQQLQQASEIISSTGGHSHGFDIQLQRQIDGNAAAAMSKMFAQAPELTIFTFTCLLVLVCIPLRFMHWTEIEDSLATVIMFLLPFNLLLFCRASKSLGSFIIMVQKILGEDVLPVFLFLNIFIFGFTQAFLMIFKTYRPTTNQVGQQQQQQQPANGIVTPDQIGPCSRVDNSTTTAQKTAVISLFESIVEGDNSARDMFDVFIGMNMIALNEFSWMVDEFSGTDYPRLANVLFCIYMIVVCILLVNVFIATLGKTYQDMSAHPNENLRQWARALLILERICSPVRRLNMLDKYSHVIEIHTAPQQAATMVSAPQPIATTFSTSGRGSRVAPQRGTCASSANASTSGTTASEDYDDGEDTLTCVQLCRCYSSTWALSERDWQEIKEIKRLKHDHELSFARVLGRSNTTDAGNDSFSAS